MKVVMVSTPLPTELPGPQRVALQQRAQRRVLARASELAGLDPESWHHEWPRDEFGAPVARDDWHWSLANTPGRVVAALARAPIGVDVEWLRRERVPAEDWLEQNSPADFALFDCDRRRAALSAWVVRETVLKKTGVGIADLARTRIVSRVSKNQLRVVLRGCYHLVRLFEVGEHLIGLSHDATAGEILTEELAHQELTS